MAAFNVLEVNEDGTEYSLTLQLLLLMTVLAVLPSILILTLLYENYHRTFFASPGVRYGSNTTKSSLIGIALFLSLFIMAPVLQQVYDGSLCPFRWTDVVPTRSEVARVPVQEFMVSHTREQDLLMFMEMANEPSVENLADIPFTVLMPAFITSELKTAFTIGFLIYIPFIIIDLVVAMFLCRWE